MTETIISIITPVYNRASLLHSIYESLCRQTCKNFEWVIVDDGSEDNVRKVVGGFALETFPIHLFQKENGGKHTAVNYGVKKAKGELVLILDSDDELPPDSLEKICKAYDSIRDKENVGGVCGYMIHRDGTVIGHPLMKGEMSSLELRFQHHVSGDMAEIFRRDVLKEFPFPEIKGEKFCPEMLIWNRIAQKYKLYVFPEVVYKRDYLDGGLTSNIVRIRMQSPVATMMTYQELTTYDVPLSVKTKAAINYWRFWCCRKRGTRYPRLGALWLWTWPLGVVMHYRDDIKC